MSSFCFLLDENLPRSLQTALWRARAGVAIVRRDAAPRDLIDDLLLILEASTPEEWRNVTVYLPLA
jgi:hypothetical protein